MQIVKPKEKDYDAMLLEVAKHLGISPKQLVRRIVKRYMRENNLINSNE